MKIAKAEHPIQGSNINRTAQSIQGLTSSLPQVGQVVACLGMADLQNLHCFVSDFITNLLAKGYRTAVICVNRSAV